MTTETTLKAYSDGFGGLSVTDVSETEEVIVNLLTEESPGEVIDGIEKLPAGHYLVKLSFWHEDNHPEAACELIVKVDGHETLKPTANEMLVEAKKHPRSHICPECEEYVGTVAMTKLIYCFEPCDCPEADYSHLVEVTYHPACYIKKHAES